MKVMSSNPILFNKSNSQGLGTGMRVKQLTFNGGDVATLSVKDSRNTKENTKKLKDKITLDLAARTIAYFQDLTGNMAVKMQKSKMENEALKAQNSKLKAALNKQIDDVPVRELKPVVQNDTLGQNMAAFV